LFPCATLTVIGPQKDTTSAGVTFVGQISEEALIAEYQRTWIYCSVSSYEGFGVPLIEAMACGAAVIAIDNSGAREVVTHECDGLLCAEDTLGDTINRVISEENLRNTLVANGLLTAKKYDIGKIADRYISLYQT
jgi:phosphatidylinositol alpha-mannosyltransferase